VLFKLSSPMHQIRSSIVVNISGCHAADPVSIPGRRVIHSSHLACEPMRPANFAPLARTTKPSQRLQLAILLAPAQVEQDLM
jgi:hypothetical protein